MQEGLKWHRAGRQALAVDRYQAAVEADPSFYEAYFNMGLAAFQTAGWQLSLSSFEMAMALRPDSVDAHYNFCIALQKANYPQDALHELKLLAVKEPNGTRAHLALGNLYDQIFRDPGKARVHYEKVLQLEPRHPKAGKIRIWLSRRQ
jgi:tetratricopeptide (TPR) repeat protein